MLAAEIAEPATAMPIDRAHLSRMTLADASLEREVLELFRRQSAMLVARIADLAPEAAAAAAHTLKGSARGVGAWRVASAAEAVEAAGGAEALRRLGELRAAVEEARTAITDLLGD